MARIKLLEQHVSERIAAGEVVERPASVVKELVENAIDARATQITVELKRNGLASIRVTDNGSGIAREDVKTAFLRHATSKIKDEDDLDAISTLGFRGEALAAIAAVSRVRMVTKTSEESFASEYCIDGGQERSFDDAAGKDGTTIYVNDIFYNTPARMSFLKSDVGEGNAVQTLLDQLALGNPDIAFTLIRDGKQVLASPGDGKLFSAIFAVLPRDVSENMVEVNGANEAICVSGFVLKPGQARRARNFQYCYVNKRFVKSRLCVAAVEEAYKDLIMVGRYPAFVVDVELPFELVDVNVHPAKTEIRFVNDKQVFGAVYGAVRAALLDFADDFSAQLKRPQQPVSPPQSEGPGKTQTVPESPKNGGLLGLVPESYESQQPDTVRQSSAAPSLGFGALDIFKQPIPEPLGASGPERAPTELDEPALPVSLFGTEGAEVPMRIVGEVLQTYIVAERGDALVLIDKHAAHERLLFEQIDVGGIHSARQMLLAPIVVSVSREEQEAFARRKDDVETAGFVVEPFGDGEVAVREAPTYMPPGGIEGAVQEIGEKIAASKTDLQPEETRWLLHSSACRAAIKAGHKTSEQEIAKLVEDILNSKIPMYCPHGRPIVLALDKKEIEKRFGRIQ